MSSTGPTSLCSLLFWRLTAATGVCSLEMFTSCLGYGYAVGFRDAGVSRVILFTIFSGVSWLSVTRLPNGVHEVFLKLIGEDSS